MEFHARSGITPVITQHQPGVINYSFRRRHLGASDNPSGECFPIDASIGDCGGATANLVAKESYSREIALFTGVREDIVSC